ncbi:MAG: TldD/PmbA family protein [Deltaproteobacteria bacterium]|nr:TldD/PmbA family protein [Deltaproteobacteria bacterium]
MYNEAYGVLKKNDFDFFDIYHEETKKRRISFKDRAVEKIDVGLDGGIGVRGVKGRSTHYAYSQDSSPLEIKKMALSICKQKESKHFKLVYAKEKSVPAFFSPLENIVNTVKKAMDGAYKISSHVTQVKCDYGDTEKQIEIVKHSGEVKKEKLNYTTFIVEVIAKEDENIQSYRNIISTAGKNLFEEYNIEELALKTTEIALKLLSAPVAPRGRMPVILASQAGGTMTHEAIGHGLEGDLIYEHLSIYSGKIGEKVASPLITLVDDATLPQARGSYFFDDEGTDGQRTILIENGILKNYMTDLMYAKLLNVNLSGNGRRECFRFPPIPRMSNTFILPGKDDPKSIIKTIDKGILVNKMGGGQVNPVTGDFVFEVKEGYMIEKGEVGELIRGATIAGNGPQILKEIDMVGNDLGMEVGTCGKAGQMVPVSDGEPTLRVPSILIGGS